MEIIMIIINLMRVMMTISRRMSDLQSELELETQEAVESPNIAAYKDL
jgi:hypothetical protein